MRQNPFHRDFPHQVTFRNIIGLEKRQAMFEWLAGLPEEEGDEFTFDYVMTEPQTLFTFDNPLTALYFKLRWHTE